MSIDEELSKIRKLFLATQSRGVIKECIYKLKAILEYHPNHPDANILIEELEDALEFDTSPCMMLAKEPPRFPIKRIIGLIIFLSIFLLSLMYFIEL